MTNNFLSISPIHHRMDKGIYGRRQIYRTKDWMEGKTKEYLERVIYAEAKEGMGVR